MMNNEQLELWKNLKEDNTLEEVQEYIRKVIEIRGFSNQSIEQAMLLLTEEIGELAKAIRKEKTTMSIDNNKIRNYDTIESEVADVFIVLCTICNKLNIESNVGFGNNKSNVNTLSDWEFINRYKKQNK